MIELINIEKSFGSHRVLNTINLTIEKGQICMLLGPSGCGKSTMIRLINQLLKPDKGSILIDGINIDEIDTQNLRRNMGYAIQGVGLFPHMLVKDNIAIVPNLLKWPKTKVNSRVIDLLDLVGLPQSYAKKYPHQLSGGEAQRVGVARALAADPDILLMDEPFGALDPINRVRLQQEFINIQQQLKKTVLFVTHDVGEAVRLADTIVLMQQGEIITQGNPFSIAHAAEHVAKAFFGNSYTLELLEKYTIGNYEALLKKDEMLNKEQKYNTEELLKKEVHINEHSIEPSKGVILQESATLHEILSTMFISKCSRVSVAINSRTYEVSFDTLLRLFGGAGQ
jgi:osmoprotectant transport system ATP-binding protein